MTRWMEFGAARKMHSAVMRGRIEGQKSRFLRPSSSLARLRMARNDKVVSAEGMSAVLSMGGA